MLTLNLNLVFATIGISFVSTGCSSLRTKAYAGDPVAQYQLAKEIYASSPDESLALLRKASTAGNRDAQYELGAYYVNLAGGPNTGSGRYSLGTDTKYVNYARFWYQVDLVTA